MEYQPGQHISPSLWYNKNCFENTHTKNCNASTFLCTPTGDLRPYRLSSLGVTRGRGQTWKSPPFRRPTPLSFLPPMTFCMGSMESYQIEPRSAPSDEFEPHYSPLILKVWSKIQLKSTHAFNGNKSVLRPSRFKKLLGKSRFYISLCHFKNGYDVKTHL